MALNDKPGQSSAMSGTRLPRLRIALRLLAVSAFLGALRAASHSSPEVTGGIMVVGALFLTGDLVLGGLLGGGYWLLEGYLGSLGLVFIGERVVGSDGLRYAFTGLGVLGVTLTTVVRFAQSTTTSGERGRAERLLAFCSAGGLAALAIYFCATTEAGRKIFGIAAAKPETRARIESASMVVWAALLVLSVLPLIFGEMALGPMRHAAMIEARRVRAALRSGLILACAAVYCALFTYAAGEVDLKVDYSYFRTARPSESTKNIAASATEPVVVKAFFPQLNDVGVEVSGYLKDLARGAPNVKIEEHDRLLVPVVAKEAKVTGDGVIVLTRGATREMLTVGTDMKVAANKLKSLDTDFQKVLLKVMREAHIAYFTVGHGELNETHTDGPEGHTAKGLRKLLENQNYTVKDLGLTQGLGTDVPADATLVMVLGPTQALLPEEIATLKRYGDRGGHLFLALDPDAKVDLDPLAAIAGLTWSPTILANDKTYMRRRFNNSDRANLATNRFSSHASVSTLSRNSARMPVVFPGASAIDKRPGQPDLKIDFAVKAMGETFEDKAGTFEYDAAADGKQSTFNLVAAVSHPVPAPAGYKGKDPPEYRAFVVADADAVSDAAFHNEPNIFLAADAIRWLGGEESFSGAITNSEDVRITHTKAKDQLWFWATIGGAPLSILALGLIVARRSRRAAFKASPSRPRAERKEKERVKAETQTLIHLGVLAASVVTAVAVWTREKDTKALASGDVVVWSGHPGDVEKASYESKTRKVSIEAKKDGAGRYFTGTSEKDPPAAFHAADAGAPPPPGPRVTVGFVSVGPGDKLAESLAPLKALRSLGKIGADRAAEFGLAEPDATVTVQIGGAEHKLLLGATTPGGGDRYVRDGASNEVYVIKGDALRNLESAESLLLERDLHEWKDAEITRARIEAGGKARELVRGGPEGKRFWADASSAETNDETLGNWMSKLERLRPSEFVLAAPEPREPLLKIDYTGRKPLGFIEVIKVKTGDKPTFYLRTEHTRLYGKVVGTQAEQLEQDLAAIVK